MVRAIVAIRCSKTQHSAGTFVHYMFVCLKLAINVLFCQTINSCYIGWLYRKLLVLDFVRRLFLAIVVDYIVKYYCFFCQKTVSSYCGWLFCKLLLFDFVRRLFLAIVV